MVREYGKKFKNLLGRKKKYPKKKYNISLVHNKLLLKKRLCKENIGKNFLKR